MQNLRDKLLGAGVVNKQEARKARTEARKRRKKGREGHDEASRQRQQKSETHRARRAAEAEAARRLEDERKAARAQKETEDRLRNVIARHALQRLGKPERAFHFAGTNRRIQRIHVSHAVAAELSAGSLGIAAAPYDETRGYRVLRLEGLQRLAELAPERILFWSGPGSTDDRPSHGATAPPLASKPLCPAG